MTTEPYRLTATDLKQYDYCARTVYWVRCIPDVRPRTDAMDAGRDEHDEEMERASRRTFVAYGAVAGTRAFELRLESQRLPLVGKLDELVTTDTGELIPVDYKAAGQVAASHKLQLSAYALLLEEAYGVSVGRGFIYLIPRRQFVEVRITAALRAKVEHALDALMTMIHTEQMPPPTGTRVRCVDCEFRRFCNDV